MFKSFHKFESASTGEEGGAGGSAPELGSVGLPVENETTPTPETQTGTANISKLEDSNIPPKPEKDESVKWRGDSRYFQTGKKQGQMKPSASVSGVDAEKVEAPTTKFSGLRTDDLKGKNTKPQITPEATRADDVKRLKEKKKELSAEFSARVVMRLLDTLVNIISKGTYGEGMPEEKIKERMTYRDMLQVEWREYLLTLDVDLAPWAMVAVGSLDYVGAAFNTTGGKERVQSITEKIGGKLFGFMLGRGKK